MALTYTIQCDGSTTSFTLARAVTTKESLSLTIASGDDAGTTVPGSDYTFSPVNNVAQSVTINWPNAANYGTVGTPVDVTVAVYHNPGADPADTLLYSYDSASAMRPEMVGRDLEHIIDLVKMVIGGADLATTSLGDQEDDIAALDVRVTAAEADIIALDARMDTAESDIDTAQADIIALEATDATHTGQLAGSASSGLLTQIANLSGLIGSPVGLPVTTPVSVTNGAAAGEDANKLYFLGTSTGGVVTWYDLVNNVQALIAAEFAIPAARWAGGARIQGGANRGDLAVSGTAGFKEGNFIDSTNTPTATEFASYYAGGTALHIYPPAGTQNTDYVFSVFTDNGSGALSAHSSIGITWDTDHWVYSSNDAPIAIYFMKVT